MERPERRTSSGRGLDWYEFVLPGRETLDACTASLDAGGYEPRASDAGVVVTDPDGMELRLRVENA